MKHQLRCVVCVRGNLVIAHQTARTHFFSGQAGEAPVAPHKWKGLFA